MADVGDLHLVPLCAGLAAWLSWWRARRRRRQAESGTLGAPDDQYQGMDKLDSLVVGSKTTDGDRSSSDRDAMPGPTTKSTRWACVDAFF
jgi:hypothetical protein